MNTTATATAYVEVRSQHSRGSSGGKFGGPDTYVAVQIVPAGVERLKVLNHTVAEKRGIEIHYIGEGYQQHTGPRSALGQALATAKEFAAKFNGQEPQIAHCAEAGYGYRTDIDL